MLAGTAALSAGAAFLAACGGSSDGDGSGGAKGTKDQSGLLSEIEDTSSSAKRGGTFKWYSGTEPNHLDGISQGQAQLNIFNGMVYSSLVSNKTGYKQPSSYNEVVPNMATSWEFSPDRTQITFKLRQGVKWQNRAPVNGRAFDSSDVVATWTRYESLPSNNRAANSNKFNPNAPIVSVTAPDASTVVYKLNEPASYMLQRLAALTTGEIGTIQPREAGSSFDPRRDQIGTGGFELAKWEPSIGFTYKRNPEYWDKEPYPETIEVPIIANSAYASGLAALASGQVYTYSVKPNDIVATKRSVPALKMYQAPVIGNNTSPTVGFGWLPSGSQQKTPFLDVRVRQAFSLAIDREAFIDVILNVTQFTKEGLPVDVSYYSSMGNIPGVGLDPRDKAFGPNSKYYTYDPAEAKKLLAAAGFSNGFEYPSNFVIAAPFGQPTYNNEVEVLDGFAREIGLKPVSTGLDYNIDYLQKFITKQGSYTGILYRAGAVTSVDAVDYFTWRYWSKAGPTSGSLFTGQGNDASAGDPEVDSLIEKAKAEPDLKKQTALLHDLQRLLGKQQYAVSRPGIASGFELAWPVLRNFRVFQNDSRSVSNTTNNPYFTIWVDETQAPVNKS